MSSKKQRIEELENRVEKLEKTVAVLCEQKMEELTNKLTTYNCMYNLDSWMDLRQTICKTAISHQKPFLL